MLEVKKMSSAGILPAKMILNATSKTAGLLGLLWTGS